MHEPEKHIIIILTHSAPYTILLHPKLIVNLTSVSAFEGWNLILIVKEPKERRVIKSGEMCIRLNK